MPSVNSSPKPPMLLCLYEGNAQPCPQSDEVIPVEVEIYPCLSCKDI